MVIFLIDDVIAVATPKSTPGSSNLTPPATLRKTSCVPTRSPIRFSKTASSSARPTGSGAAPAADGDLWLWDLEMQHYLYVADLPGEYSMSFELFVGDAVTAAPLAGYTPAAATLAFVVPAPEPASALLAGLALVGFAARRK